MAKDIILGNSTYLNVEQIKFRTPAGDVVAFLDADRKNPRDIICSISYKTCPKFSRSLESVAMLEIPATSTSYKICPKFSKHFSIEAVIPSPFASVSYNTES